MTQLSLSALRFLAWIRDNEHYESNWIGSFGETNPDNLKHIRLSGDHGSIKIHRDVVSEAAFYFEEVPDTEFRKRQRMYRPNAAGMKALEEAECSDAP